MQSPFSKIAPLLLAVVTCVSSRAADEFGWPRKSVGEVRVMPVSERRVVVSGVVTYVTSPGGAFTVQDATGPAWVYPPVPPRQMMPALGDVVEVAAARTTARDPAPQLADAVWRVTGRGTVPEAPLLTPAQAMETAYDGYRVRLRGRVIDFETFTDGAKKISRVWVRAGEVITYGNYIGTELQPAPAKVGQLVELEGVIIVAKIAPRVVRNVAIQLHRMEDARALPEPPAWEDPTTRRMIAIVAVVLGIAGAWVFLLRRQVRARTALLAESEARHRLVVDTALDAVISLDESRRITGWNAQAERTFGWKAGEALGRPCAEMILPRNGHAPAENGSHGAPQELSRALAAGEEWLLSRRLEITAAHRDGRVFPAEFAMTPLKADGRTGFSAFIREITAQKQAENELLRTLERERELGQLKTKFISMVSHEFRTPLEAILSSADILDRYLERLDPEERVTHLKSIQVSVKRMAAMMEEVLVLGRLDAGRLPCQPDDLHLVTWCTRLVDEMMSSTAGKCPILLRSGDFDPLVRADEGLLRHIFTNLLSNAVKYSPPGEPVIFSIAREGTQAVFEIADRGLGIPEADRPRLFEAFYRGANAGHTPGTGLGLLIVKRCVDLHGGTIELVGSEGKGTTAIVRLPVFEIPKADTRI